MTNHNKKLIVIIAIIIGFLIGVIFYFYQPTTKTQTTTPIINNEQPLLVKNELDTIVNIGSKVAPNSIALDEKNKIKDLLPLRVKDFSTTSGVKTTINVYSLSSDPESVMRIEIYNINFNIDNLNGVNAIAFKDSMNYVVNWLKSKNINPKNLQIIYGNRQYIQDTASYWVNTFKLLD